MSAITTASPSEPVYDYEDAGPLTDEESLLCAEECFLACDRAEAAQENTLSQ